MQNGPYLILNVDDNEVARYARGRVLMAAGFRVEDAASGGEALRLAEQLHPSLVLLDVRLPDIDGFEVCRRLMEMAEGEKPVIVHVSALAADGHSQVTGLENGADAYLTEPVEPDVLVATVRSALRERQTRSALVKERDQIAGTSARLVAVLESTTDCVMYLEPDWRISYLNTRAKNAIGGGRELTGCNVWEMFPEAVDSPFFMAYSAAMRGREAAHFDAWYDPLGAWFEVHAYPSEGGGLAVFFRDITEKKRIETERRRSQEELERRENEYKTLAENAPEVIARFDRELRHTYVNEYGARVYGFPREQVIGKTNAELGMPPERVALWKKHFEEVLATGRQRTVDFEFDSPNFGHQYFSSLFVPEFGAGGEVLSILAITRDVTELRRAGEELRRANTVMETIGTGATLMIGMKDTGGRYVTANAAMLELMGRPEAEVYGRCDLELLGPETGAEVMAADRRVMSTGRTETVEEHITRPHGEYWVLATKTPLRDHEGNVTGVVVVANDITERKRAEERLRESEGRLQAIVENLSEGLIVAGPQGQALHWNRAALRMHGYARQEEALGELPKLAEFYELATPEGEVLAFEQWPIPRLLRGEQLNDCEMLLRHKQRDWERIFSYGGTLVRDGRGEPWMVVLTVRDVTRRKRAEQKLRESEERLAMAQRVARCGCFDYDAQSNTSVWSTELEELYGLAPGEFDGRPETWAACLDPEDREKAGAIIGRAAEIGVARFRIRRRDNGEVRWIETRGRTFRDPSGAPQRRVGFHIDITEQKRAEEALLESERHFRELADSMPQLVWVTQPDGQHVYFNRRWYEQLGVDANESLGERWSDLLHPEDRARCLPYWRRCLETGETYQTEYRFRLASGEYRWFLGRAVPVRDGQGRITRWFGTSTDIEDSKRAEAALRQAQKLESVGLLAGGIAHDFNNLLVGVIGNASLAAELLPPGHVAAGILASVIKSGEQAAHLTRQLLAYAGKGRFVVEPVNLSTLVREAATLIESSVSKRIAFQFQLQPGIPAVESDLSQMQQVLMNLALNAAEAIGDSPGVISINTGEMVADEAYIAGRQSGWGIAPGRYVFLEVGDTGCGMDKATLEKIFDPFFTTKFQGRGLGLAAVAGIVRSHKGAIDVTTAPGAGTAFRVLLPPMKPGAHAAHHRRERRVDLHGTGTVLVVDDEEIVRNLAKHALERQGYTVLLAENGAAAIELVRSEGERIGLVVLDLGMPGLSGEETLPRLRESRPDLNVVISSGYSEAEALRLFRGARVSGFIQKPYTVAQLAKKVKRAMK